MIKRFYFIAYIILIILSLVIVTVPAWGANVTYYGLADSGTSIGADTTDSPACNATEATNTNILSLMETDTTNYCTSKEAKVRIDPGTESAVTFYNNTAYSSAMTITGNGTATLGTPKCKTTTGTFWIYLIDYDPSTGTNSVADSTSVAMASGSGPTTIDITGLEGTVANGHKLGIKAQIFCDASDRVEHKWAFATAGKEYTFPITETVQTGGGAARRRTIIMQ